MKPKMAQKMIQISRKSTGLDQLDKGNATWYHAIMDRTPYSAVQ